jgi:hypothetical protein
MTRSEAITALYALFNAPHNADINLVGLNVLLDELYKSHPQEEPWPEEPEGHIAGGVHPPQRTWVGLTYEEKSAALYDKEGMTLDYEDYAEAIEAKLRSKNEDRN